MGRRKVSPIPLVPSRVTPHPWNPFPDRRESVDSHFRRRGTWHHQQGHQITAETEGRRIFKAGLTLGGFWIIISIAAETTI